MKAPAFWYRPVGIAARCLAPLSCLYRAGGAVRRAVAKPYQAAVPVICVGNIVAGGSGKTPTALALASLLEQRAKKPVFVTRGYGGRERGPLRVDPLRHTAAEVGDEALLLARSAPVWIGRDRVAALREAEKEATHIILDDGLQNPNVLPDLALLVVDAGAGFGNGHVIPAGPLRETLGEALRRIDAIVLVGEGRQDAIEGVGVPVLRASLEAVIPPDFPRDEKFLAFAGIGRPEKFYQACLNAGLTLVRTRDFPDHHVFSERELDDLVVKVTNSRARLLTTEKDFVRLPLAFRMKVETLPVRLVFEDVGAVERMLGL